MNPLPQRILFFGKAEDGFCQRAAEYLSLHVAHSQIYFGKRGDSFPGVDPGEDFDYVISYLSPWIIPEELLKRARYAAINFHPGPPEYPGIGCTNFAIYDGVTIFGVTCHHMNLKVDTGQIIRVLRFPLYPTDTVLSLTWRCHAYIGYLFYEILDLIISGKTLPTSPERWTRRPFRRSELNELCRLTPDMSGEEIQRRIRATTFPGYRSASFDSAGLAGPSPGNPKEQRVCDPGKSNS